MDAGPDYSSFTDSIHIPFTNEDEPATTPAIDVKVNGELIEGVGLDTGSSVFALRQDLVPGFAKADQSKLTPGHIEYSTGGRRWDGFWFKASVTFEGTEKITMSSEMEILVITKQTAKHRQEDGTTKVEEEHDEVHYMGIGFGIFDKERGFTPDKNALLAVTEYNDKPINESTFRHGFVLQKRSVDIGLTSKNTDSFQCTKLSYGSHQDIKWYWDFVSSALSLSVNGKPLSADDKPWIRGTALVDTGITKMEIYDPHYKGEEDPDDHGLPHGIKVAIRFPDENTSLPEYSFTWSGKKEPWLPVSVQYYQSINARSYVNTGQTFYEKFDTLFDADKGFWGVRKKSTA